MDDRSNQPLRRRSGMAAQLFFAATIALVVAVGAGVRVHAGTAQHAALAGKKSGVTPLPSATPVKPRSGLILGMITRPISQVQAIQAAADRHEKAYLFYLKPDDVVKNTLGNYGFKGPIDLVSPVRPFPRYAGRPVRKGEVKYQGQLYQVFTAQPLRHGPTGVWVIVTILPQKLITGPITHPLATVRRVQALANKDKADGLIFLDPDRVVQEELPQYGFVPATATKNCTTKNLGYKVIAPAHTVPSSTGRPLMLAVVDYQNTRYNVYLAQPVSRGKGGVWVVVNIEPAY